MKQPLLTSERRIRAVNIAASATVGLYLMTVFIAEPMHGFAVSTDVETAIVQVTVAAAIGLACDANQDGRNGSGETLNIGSITYSGDTGVYSDTRAVKCRVSTNNITGYTLGWRILTGSGGLGTGHLISQYRNIIAAFGTGSNTNNTSTWSVATNDSRWGGRVSSTSSGSDVAPMSWGTDASTEKWARVKTGATLTIRQSPVQSQNGSGDLIKIGFRAQIGTIKNQPSGTYQATVTFTASTQ